LAEETVREGLAEHDLDLDVTALPRRSAGLVWTPPANRSNGGAFVSSHTPPPAQIGLDLVF
jgi:hypothetical protein